MSLDTLMREVVTIERATDGAADGYGVPVKTWATVATTRAWVTQISGDEQQDPNRQTTFAGWMLYLGPDVDLRATDRVVRDDGTRIEIIEPPHYARRGITGEVHHIEARGATTVG